MMCAHTYCFRDIKHSVLFRVIDAYSDNSTVPVYRISRFPLVVYVTGLKLKSLVYKKNIHTRILIFFSIYNNILEKSPHFDLS
jgi:hypothetical protein